MNTAAPSQGLPIEKRVATLEKQMAAILPSSPANIRAAANDWLKTVGTWQDGPLSREADQLGEEWRQSVKD